MQSANLSNWISLLTAIVAFHFLFGQVLCCLSNSQRKRDSPSCQSSETFFDGRCLPIGSSEHCPTNMELFDGPNNEGFCDCQDIDGKPAFYSDKTGQCSFHNTQGPCSDGEWFVLKKGYPVCEPVPEGCPADGNHFYGTPDGTMLAKQCLDLWKKGPPCLPDDHLQLREGPELHIVCGPLISPQSISLSAGMLSSCRPGTRRTRSGHCSGGAFYG